MKVFFDQSVQLSQYWRTYCIKSNIGRSNVFMVEFVFVKFGLFICPLLLPALYLKMKLRFLCARSKCYASLAWCSPFILRASGFFFALQLVSGEWRNIYISFFYILAQTVNKSRSRQLPAWRFMLKGLVPNGLFVHHWEASWVRCFFILRFWICETKSYDVTIYMKPKRNL